MPGIRAYNIDALFEPIENDVLARQFTQRLVDLDQGDAQPWNAACQREPGRPYSGTQINCPLAIGAAG